MADLEPFTPEAIEEHLRRAQIRYTRDEDGRCLALYEPTTDRVCGLEAWYSAEGPQKGICSIRVGAIGLFPTDEQPVLLGLLNRWNSEMRWPKVYLLPTPEPSMLRLVGEGHLDLSCGVHAPGLDLFGLMIVGAAHTFFRWIEAERRSVEGETIDFDELQRRLREES
ncbi:MAG: YbjN domain-containing protein [Actinobacteria bacterium]|nr:MAG: YbjN domain-containing protein [Actinomycetota bacterium]